MENLFTIVINLARNPERKTFMEAQLEKMSIPHVFLDASDGEKTDFSQVYNEKIAIQKNGTPLTSSEKGCALSHRRALELFLTSNKPFGLILEDDIELSFEFPSALVNVLKNTPQSWTYLQFNYTPTGWKGVKLWWFLFVEFVKQNNQSPLFLFTLPFRVVKGLVTSVIYLIQGVREWWTNKTDSFHISKAYKDHYLAGCYIVTRESAQALININTPITYTADRVQNIARRENKIVHALYTPRLARQKRESFESSIYNKHFGKEVISY